MHGFDVTLISKVIADTLRKYDFSIEMLKKYDDEFVVNHKAVAFAVDNLAHIRGGVVQEFITELVEEIKEYAFIVAASDKPNLIQFMIVEEVKRILDTLVSLDAVFATLHFDQNVQLH
ncbi:hypothetical protein C7A11_26530 [Pseudomonas simiae]|nr:hypothetical protein C7A11_26530 [Pseudomonas simiae]